MHSEDREIHQLDNPAEALALIEYLNNRGIPADHQPAEAPFGIPILQSFSKTNIVVPAHLEHRGRDLLLNLRNERHQRFPSLWYPFEKIRYQDILRSRDPFHYIRRILTNRIVANWHNTFHALERDLKTLDYCAIPLVMLMPAISRIYYRRDNKGYLVLIFTLACYFTALFCGMGLMPWPTYLFKLFDILWFYEVMWFCVMLYNHHKRKPQHAAMPLPRT